MNKQLEFDFSTIVDLRDDIKEKIINKINDSNYTLDQLQSIYRHIYVSTEKFKPLQKRSGHVYFIYKGTSPRLPEILNLEVNEQNSKIYKIGKSCTTNVINRVTGQIDIPKFNKKHKHKKVYQPMDNSKKVLAVSNLLDYEIYSKLERDLHKKYSKNRLRRSEEFIGLTEFEIKEIKQILGGGISVKELRDL
tara:strand:+ start:81 stop:656 length:576 start_codon:yes stop_codon:yes gene_type:complete